MHGGPIDPDRIRNTHRFDPERSEQRTSVGAVITVGLLAVGVLAMSYPIAIASATGFVAGTAWGVRSVYNRLRRTDGSFPEWNEPETVEERLAALIPRWDHR